MVSEYFNLYFIAALGLFGGYNKSRRKSRHLAGERYLLLRKATRFINIADGYEAYKYDIKTIKKPEGKKYCLIRLDIF